MQGKAYFIDNRNQILELGHGTHIDVMIQNPAKFGFTISQIKTAYEKYGERVGQEGKAREELIENALKRGFIHIRLYPNRYWSVTVWNYGSREKRVLSEWAFTAEKDKMAGPYMEVRIVAINSGETKRTSIDELKSGLYENNQENITKFVEFVEFGLKTFKDFIKKMR